MGVYWFVLQYFVSFKVCNHLAEKEKAACCYCCVALTRGSIGFSAVFVVFLDHTRLLVLL